MIPCRGLAYDKAILQNQLPSLDSAWIAGYFCSNTILLFFFLLQVNCSDQAETFFNGFLLFSQCFEWSHQQSATILAKIWTYWQIIGHSCMKTKNNQPKTTMKKYENIKKTMNIPFKTMKTKNKTWKKHETTLKTDLLEKRSFFVNHGAPQLTLLKKCSHFDVNLGHQLTFFRKCSHFVTDRGGPNKPFRCFDFTSFHSHTDLN